ALNSTIVTDTQNQTRFQNTLKTALKEAYAGGYKMALGESVIDNHKVDEKYLTNPKIIGTLKEFADPNLPKDNTAGFQKEQEKLIQQNKKGSNSAILSATVGRMSAPTMPSGFFTGLLNL